MDGQMSTMALLTSLGPTALKTLGGLGLLLLGGRFVLRRIFEIVAQARSDETFVALCLLTVTGASLCTQRLGFSDTLGAFCAGVLLAETNYRTQVVIFYAIVGIFAAQMDIWLLATCLSWHISLNPVSILCQYSGGNHACSCQQYRQDLPFGSSWKPFLSSTSPASLLLCESGFAGS